MKIKAKSYDKIILEEVFNPLLLVSYKKEKISIVMRDSGFELWYQDKEDGKQHEYEFKNGVVKKMKELTKGNDTNDIGNKNYTNKMTSKEKAKELVDKFYQTTPNESLINQPIGLKEEYKAWEQSKQCALIAVDEIIETEILIDEDIYVETPSYLQYWKEVKTEIKLL
jgi:hypothetical protein